MGSYLRHHAFFFRIREDRRNHRFCARCGARSVQSRVRRRYRSIAYAGKFNAEVRWNGVRFIRGLLTDAPAVSLQLDDFAGELYADDRSGTPIEDYVPDYDILDQIEYKYPVRDAYFAYASRGCIRKCSFCGVPKLEGDLRDTESLAAVVRAIEERHGTKKDLSVMNIVAS